MTFKKHIFEKLTILCLLSAVLVPISGTAVKVGAGFQVDTMELCKSYEVKASTYDHRLPDDCISVFK